VACALSSVIPCCINQSILYKIDFLDSRNVLLVFRDIFQALLPAISCCIHFVAGLRYVNVLLSNLNNSFVGVPPLQVYLMIQIMIPGILCINRLGQYRSQCRVQHNKEVNRIPHCIPICIIEMMQC
jgi:hypothetical protein